MQGSGGHIEFTGAPDPMRMMEMLGSMDPGERDALMRKVKEMTPMMNSDPTSQEGIREHWRKLKETSKKTQRVKKQRMHTFTHTQSWDVKKDLPGSSLDPSKYAPIKITDMGVGTTHRGRILIGRVSDVGGFWSIASGAVLIEDLCGAVMEVAVYNYPEERFANDFPPGREVCIIEPYLKWRGDGSVGIRVDKPAEISDYPFPTTGEKWKALGNLCIKHCPEMAVVCYESGLRAPNQAALDLLRDGSKANVSSKKMDQEALGLMLQVSKLLTNLSICEFNLNNFDSSLLHALLAFGLALDIKKAAFWVAKSLHSSGLEDEARRFAAWYCRHDATNSSSLRSEFHLTENDINSLEGGAAWISGSTLTILARACKPMKIDLPECDEHWLTMKQHGTDCFKEGKTLEARARYAAALSACPFLVAMFRDTSFLISNKGAAWLSTTNSPIDSINGAVTMLCATLLNCDNGRAWIRVGKFLELQGRGGDAVSFLEEAATLIEVQKLKLPFLDENKLTSASSSTLKTLKAELDDTKRRAASRKNVKDINPVSTKEQRKQRTAVDAKSGRSLAQLEEETMTSEQLYNMYKMVLMFGDSTKTAELKQMAGPTLDRPFEDYSTDILQTLGVPDGLDKEFVRKVLYWSYVKDRIDPWWRALGWRMAWSGKEGSGGELGKVLTDEEDMFKRWHGTYPMKIIAEDPAKYARPGAIIDIRSMKPANSYESRIRSNFVNCPHRNEVFFEGTSHLAIGFNDLNSLINCKWMQAVEAEYQGKPARFVGLEMNPFNVAKTLVIAEMLTEPEIPLDEVLQAWYSSVWSQKTLASFRRCARSVLGKGEHGLAPHRLESWGSVGSFLARNVSDVKVASYLHHWLSVKPLNFKDARRLWLENIMQGNSKMFRQISSCKRRQDMLAIAQYVLTGEVFGSGDFQPHGLNAVGSLTYWQCPEGSPPLDEECMFNAFALEDLMATFFDDRSKNLVQVFEAKVLGVLHCLRSKLLSGSLTVELYVGEVKPLSQPDGHDLVNFIVNRVVPYTVGWSNVIDYIELGDLHDLGRAMSSHGDVAHYGYTMNWPTETFGANIIDLEMTHNYAAANYILDLALGENYSGENPEMVNTIQALRASTKADEVFKFPDHDTPMNSTSFIASNMMKEHWVKHFYEKAGGMKEVGKHFTSSSEFRFLPTNCGFNTPGGPISVVIPCPLHRISTQIYLGWTYDPKLKLQQSLSPPTKMEMEMMASFFGGMGLS